MTTRRMNAFAVDRAEVNGCADTEPSLFGASRVARRDALDRRARRMSDAPPARASRYAVVCAANFNRSMEAHRVFADAGLDVASFGAGARVKLPGASRDDPNVYAFDDISYEDIASDLERQPRETVENYEARGMFDMLRRNAKIKPRPNRWQTHSDAERFDVVVCFEERVFDLVVRDLREKEKGADARALVVNVEVRDSHGESVEAAPKALRLCQALEASEEWECEVDDIMDAFEAKEGMRPLYTVCYY